MRILIVGAGLAGLALARALGNLGISFELAESGPALRAEGAGIFLPGNATRALRMLGVLDDVEARAHRCASQSIHDRDGRLLHRMDLDGFWHACGPSLSLSRPVLHRIMAQGLPAASVETGRRVASIIQHGEALLVHFASGEVEYYDLVVGADGIHSTVRAQLFPRMSGPRALGQRCWRFIVENTIGLESWTVMLGKGRALLAIPIEDGRLYVYADVSEPARSRQHESQGPASESAAAAIERTFADFVGPLTPLLDDLPRHGLIHTSQLSMIPYVAGSRNDAVLIGDAAHASSPNMAQGAALAFEDALVLARAIASEPSLGAALAKFHQLRGARVGHVQKQCMMRDRLRAMPDFVRRGVLGNFGDALYRRGFGPLLGSIYLSEF